LAIASLANSSERDTDGSITRVALGLEAKNGFPRRGECGQAFDIDRSDPSSVPRQPSRENFRQFKVLMSISISAVPNSTENGAVCGKMAEFLCYISSLMTPWRWRVSAKPSLVLSPDCGSGPLSGRLRSGLLVAGPGKRLCPAASSLKAETRRKNALILIPELA
jgi:hypothetical protein